MESNIPRLPRENARRYSGIAAQMDEDENQLFQPTAFGSLCLQVFQIAPALKDEGVKRGELAGLISDNRPEWLVTAIALQCNAMPGRRGYSPGCDSTADEAELLGIPELQALISNEIFRLISAGAGFKLFEKIVRFTVLRERFEIGRELSAKGEIKRRALNEIHERAVASLFDVD